MVLNKLSIDGDITKYINNDNFPHQVIIYLKEKQITCSGLVLSYHSSVLETKIREENGEIMFDELMEEGNNDDQLMFCVRMLHGYDPKVKGEDLDISFITTLLKFSSWYEVNSLLKMAVNLLDARLLASVNIDEKMKDLFSVLKITGLLKDKSDQQNLKQLLRKYLSADHLVEFLENNIDYCDSLDGIDIASVMLESERKSGKLLITWAKPSSKNQLFVLENSEFFSFSMIFPNRSEFGEFIAIISNNDLSKKQVKVLIDIQQTYFSYPGSASSAAALQNPTNKVPQLPAPLQPQKITGTNKVPQLATPLQPQNTTGTNKVTIINGNIHHSNGSRSGHYDGDYVDEFVLHVENMPPATSSDDVFQLFNLLGRIRSVKIDTNNNSAIVEFCSSKPCQTILSSFDTFYKYTPSPEWDNSGVVECFHENRYKCSSLLIENFPQNISEQEVREYLSDCGGIAQIQLQKEYVLVTFRCPYYVTGLLNELDGTGVHFSYGGRDLKVRRCYEHIQNINFSPSLPEWMYHDDANNLAYDIHILGLPQGTSTVELRSMVEKSGAKISLSRIRYGVQINVAFVKFENDGSFKRAISFFRKYPEELQIKSQYVYVELCNHRVRKDRQIWVGDLPMETCEHVLMELFREHGEVEAVEIKGPYHRPYAFVQFYCSYSKEMALAHYEEVDCYLDDEVLEVHPVRR